MINDEFLLGEVFLLKCKIRLLGFENGKYSWRVIFNIIVLMLGDGNADDTDEADFRRFFLINLKINQR